MQGSISFHLTKFILIILLLLFTISSLSLLLSLYSFRFVYQLQVEGQALRLYNKKIGIVSQELDYDDKIANHNNVRLGAILKLFKYVGIDMGINLSDNHIENDSAFLDKKLINTRVKFGDNTETRDRSITTELPDIIDDDNNSVAWSSEIEVWTKVKRTLRKFHVKRELQHKSINRSQEVVYGLSQLSMPDPQPVVGAKPKWALKQSRAMYTSSPLCKILESSNEARVTVKCENGQWANVNTDNFTDASVKIIQVINVTGMNFLPGKFGKFCQSLENLTIENLKLNDMPISVEVFWCENNVGASTLRNIALSNVTGSQVFVSNQLRKLPKLQSVSFTSSDLKFIWPAQFSRCMLVESLSLSNNKIQIIYLGAFARMPVLRSIDLSKNFITEIASSIFRGTYELESVDLSYNKLSFIPNVFKRTTKVNRISLARNRLQDLSLRDIPKTVASNIDTLELYGNVMSSIYILPYFVNLNRLYLQMMPITSFPCNDIPTKLDKLRYISPICQCGFAGIKNWLSNTVKKRINTSSLLGLYCFDLVKSMNTTLVNYNFSNCTCNHDTNISPQDFSNFCKVTSTSNTTTSGGHLIKDYLECRYLDYHSLNQHLKSLIYKTNTYVTKYYFMGVNLSSDEYTLSPMFPYNINRNGPTELHLVECDITNITMKFNPGKNKLWLTNITELDLSYNLISNIGPDAFFYLKNLTTLNLTGNRLSILKVHYFVGMKALVSLLLCVNNIVTIEPKVFETLTSLKQLSLNSNRLTSILASDIPYRLLRLHLHDNYLTYISPALIYRDIVVLTVADNDLKCYCHYGDLYKHYSLHLKRVTSMKVLVPDYALLTLTQLDVFFRNTFCQHKQLSISISDLYRPTTTYKDLPCAIHNSTNQNLDFNPTINQGNDNRTGDGTNKDYNNTTDPNISAAQVKAASLKRFMTRTLPLLVCCVILLLSFIIVGIWLGRAYHSARVKRDTLLTQAAASNSINATGTKNNEYGKLGDHIYYESDTDVDSELYSKHSYSSDPTDSRTHSSANTSGLRSGTVIGSDGKTMIERDTVAYLPPLEFKERFDYTDFLGQSPGQIEAALLTGIKPNIPPKIS